LNQLFLALALLPSMSFADKAPQGVAYPAEIIKVTDGDTVVIAAPYLPAPLKPQLAVRIFGVDTPEKGSRAKCTAEDSKGQAASKFTTKAVKQSTKQQVVIYDWDKYGGRVLGDVILNGQSLRTMLIQNGYAREYYGEAKKSWCQ
jgi:endonuclease YncB( thermonuclease family)